ncbi:MAG: hypothetical protein ABIS01_03195 [Ferruginibacter sp.]
MKQVAIVVFLTLGTVLVSFAQKGDDKKQKNNDTAFQSMLILKKEPRFLLNIHTGYSYGLGSTFKFYADDIRAVDVSKTGNNPVQKTFAYRNPWKGLGDGFRIGGGLSVIVNDFINLGVDVDYFKSTITKTRDSSYHQITDSPPPGQAEDYTYKEELTLSYDATLITIIPHITFKAISKPKWFIYNKIGAVITFRPNSLETDYNKISIRQGARGVFRDSSSIEIKKYDWVIRKPAVGFMGAFGIQFKVTRALRAFGEIQFSHIVFIVKKKSLTEFMVNQKDMTNTLSVNVRELDFVNSFIANLNEVNPNKPSQTLVQRLPISYVGGQVGLAFQF